MERPKLMPNNHTKAAEGRELQAFLFSVFSTAKGLNPQKNISFPLWERRDKLATFSPTL